MSKPSSFMLSMLSATRRMRRAVAVAACLAVVSWTLLSAIHVHDHDHAAGTDRVDCALCLALPAGAAPPQGPVLQLVPPPSALQVQAPAALAPASGSLSSFRSRAPPAI